MCCKFAISFDDRSVVPKVYFQGISSELSVIWVYVDSKRYVVMIRKDVAVHCGRRSHSADGSRSDDAALLEHFLQLAALVKLRSIVASANAVAVDEHAGHRTGSGKFEHVGLNFGTIGALLDLNHFHPLLVNRILCQDRFSFSGVWAVCFRKDDHLLRSEGCINKDLDVLGDHDGFARPQSSHNLF